MNKMYETCQMPSILGKISWRSLSKIIYDFTVVQKLVTIFLFIIIHDDSIDRTLKSIIDHTEDSLTAVHFKGTPKAGSTEWISCTSAHT